MRSDYGAAHAISEIITQADVRILKLVLTGVCFWFVWPQTKKKRKKRRVRTLSLAGQSGSDGAPVCPRWLWGIRLQPSCSLKRPQVVNHPFEGALSRGWKGFRWNLCCHSAFYCRFNMWKNKLEVNQPCGSALLTQCCFQEFIIRAGPNDRAGFILQPVNGI